MTTNKSQTKTADQSQTGAKATPAKEAQANNAATAEAKKIKGAAIAEAKKIIDDAGAQAEQIIKNAKDEAVLIGDDAVAEAEEYVEKAKVTVEDLEQRDKDDLSRGATDVDSEKQPYRNEGAANLFTEAGRCRPNKVVMLTEEQAGQYKGLVPCNTANE